jgi:hypothetical protein
MVYGLGRTHYAAEDASELTVVGKEHQYSFPGSHRSAELARLFLQALEELNARAVARQPNALGFSSIPIFVSPPAACRTRRSGRRAAKIQHLCCAVARCIAYVCEVPASHCRRHNPHIVITEGRRYKGGI